MFDTENLNSIEKIAATIAHEVKNPLSLVKANIDLLEQADKEKTYSNNYTVMRKELNKINDLISDILQLTKQDKIIFDVIYLNDIVTNNLDAYKLIFDNKIEFYIFCENKDIAILGDKNSFSRVFINLVKNSIESINHDKGEISIFIEEDKKHAFLKIVDNGIGIPKENTNKINNAFFTTKKDGNGLGLPICKEILKKHNGSLELTGNFLGGCTALVTLPKVV